MSDAEPTPAPGSALPAPSDAPVGPATAALQVRALELAQRAVDEPLYPQLGLRCPRCGSRLCGPAALQTGEAAPAAPAPSVPAECPRCKVVVRSKEAGALLKGPRGPIGEIFRGAICVPRGFFTIVRHPKLWPFAAVPLLLNIVAIVLALLFALYVVNPWLDAKIAAWIEAGGAWAWLQYGLVGFKWLFGALVFPLVAFLLVCPGINIPYKLMFMPVMELLTEATERRLLGFKDEDGFDMARFMANLLVAVVDAILLTLLQVTMLILLAPMNFLPVVGNLFWGVFLPASFASMDYTDLNLVRRGYTTKEKIHLWRNYQWRFFGYGLSFFFLITLPVVNAFVIPAATAGGALLYLELDRK